MTLLPHRFRPPKKTDENKWEVVKILVDNGFYYQHILELRTIDNTKYLEYPDNPPEAKEFMIKYKNQARK